NVERLFRQSQSLPGFIRVLRAAFAVRLPRALYFLDTLADTCLADDDLGLPIVIVLRVLVGSKDRSHVMTILNMVYIPAIALVAHTGIFALAVFTGRIEGDPVGVVK